MKILTCIVILLMVSSLALAGTYTVDEKNIKPGFNKTVDYYIIHETGDIKDAKGEVVASNKVINIHNVRVSSLQAKRAKYQAIVDDIDAQLAAITKYEK